MGRQGRERGQPFRQLLQSRDRGRDREIVDQSEAIEPHLLVFRKCPFREHLIRHSSLLLIEYDSICARNSSNVHARTAAVDVHHVLRETEPAERSTDHLRIFTSPIRRSTIHRSHLRSPPSEPAGSARQILVSVSNQGLSWRLPSSAVESSCMTTRSSAASARGTLARMLPRSSGGSERGRAEPPQRSPSTRGGPSRSRPEPPHRTRGTGSP